MYRLFSRVHRIKQMSDIFRSYASRAGSDIISRYKAKSALDRLGLISDLINFNENLNSIISNYLEDNYLFYEASKDVRIQKKKFRKKIYPYTLLCPIFQALSAIVNDPIRIQNSPLVYQVSELLSYYYDHVIRSSKLDDNEIDVLAGKIVRLFSHVSDKDTFQEFYRRSLAKRLVVFPKTNIDAEKIFITKLKVFIYVTPINNPPIKN